MIGRVGSVALVTLILASALCAGCVGLAPVEGDRFAPAAPGDVEDTRLAPTTVEAALTEPDVVAPVQRALPGLIQTIHANGIVWLGFNMITAQAGQLSDYDGGEGGTVGLAFGNGEDIKRFLELVFVETKHHQYRFTDGLIKGDVDQNQFYVGGRRYLLPVTGVSIRGAPFFVAGICWNNMANTGDGGTADTEMSSAYGMGFYAGTGIELYLGTQLAICLDVRASYWNWEGIPGNTGYQSNAGGSVSLAYHF